MKSCKSSLHEGDRPCRRLSSDGVVFSTNVEKLRISEFKRELNDSVY